MILYFPNIVFVIYFLDLLDPSVCLHCRTVSVQKSCSVFGLFLLGVSGRLSLSRIDSCLCSGGFLHGLRVNIRCQLCVALHQPETKEGNWRNEGEGWIERVTCEIQHRPSFFFFLFFFCWAGSRTGSEKQIFSHSISALFTHVKTFQRNETGNASQRICKKIFNPETWSRRAVTFVYQCVFVMLWLHTFEYCFLSLVI